MLRNVIAFTLVIIALVGCTEPTPTVSSTIITNAVIHNGSGSEPFVGAVRFDADRIIEIGEFEALEGAGESITLDKTVSHHLLRVTGVAPGELIELFDGHGSRARGRLRGVEKGHAVVDIVETLSPEVLTERYLLIAVLKQQTMDRVMRMAPRSAMPGIME